MRYLYFLDKTLPVAFWLIMIFGFDMLYISILTVISVIIHESGHIAVSLITSTSTNSLPKGRLNGLKLAIKNRSSYKNELLVAIAGPLANIIVFLLAVIMGGVFKISYLYDFAYINLMSGLSNLIPVKGYDGYKILECTVCRYFYCNNLAQKALIFIPIFFCIIMVYISLFFLLKVGEGYWIFAVFFTMMISSTLKWRENYLS